MVQLVQHLLVEAEDLLLVAVVVAVGAAVELPLLEISCTSYSCCLFI
jgi:hypothetical protein